MLPRFGWRPGFSRWLQPGEWLNQAGPEVGSSPSRSAARVSQLLQDRSTLPLLSLSGPGPPTFKPQPPGALPLPHPSQRHMEISHGVALRLVRAQKDHASMFQFTRPWLLGPPSSKPSASKTKWPSAKMHLSATELQIAADIASRNPSECERSLDARGLSRHSENPIQQRPAQHSEGCPHPAA